MKKSSDIIVLITLAVITLIGGAGSSLASSPSFDCANAGNNAEKLICSNNGLADADAKLAMIYKQALHSTSDKENLVKGQIAWMRDRRNLCQDVPCMAAAYEDRIAALSLSDNNQSATTTTHDDGDSIPTGEFSITFEGAIGLLEIKKHDPSSTYEVNFNTVEPYDPMSRCFMRWDNVKPKDIYKLTRLDSCDDSGEGHKCEHNAMAVEGSNDAAFTLRNKGGNIELAAQEDSTICIRDGKIINGLYTKIDNATYKKQMSIVEAEIAREETPQVQQNLQTTLPAQTSKAGNFLSKMMGKLKDKLPACSSDSLAKMGWTSVYASSNAEPQDSDSELARTYLQNLEERRIDAVDKPVIETFLNQTPGLKEEDIRICRVKSLHIHMHVTGGSDFDQPVSSFPIVVYEFIDPADNKIHGWINGFDPNRKDKGKKLLDIHDIEAEESEPPIDVYK